ncbi:LamG-like jellyroll fold domain-containing protein [Runella salmonicolor]|uniref:Carboxypeptidase regulatory-like domain-containing protein n=1 Tax=Runella salmonicolor TaxID=2950278 RepID=A0ABT1FWV0_9BACT|nr:LamG-like jellyroll fold domain-containing protein [Runella salmonicolor]MCP1386244.1 carboxypeptidase regulatory-like domain-containing protein [Runella salmonicolor]
MKTLAHLRYLLLLSLILLNPSCNRDKDRNKPIPENQGITVTVQDIKTNKPVANAQVNLTTLSKSLPTLSDGTARFTSLEISNAYQLTVSKTGYATETKAVIVEVGKNTPVLFQLKPVLEFVPAQLDFAAQERIKKFDIINNSDKDVGFSIKVNNNWISVEPTSGTIPKDGRRVPITVTVDDKGRIPAKYEGTLTLDFGGAVPSENYPIFMTVPNVDAPSVSCDQPVGITRTSAEVLGTIMSVGKTPITNHGHVWSETQTPEWGVPGTYTDFKARGTGQFTSTIGPLKPGTIYYVRAYARNENGINYSKEEYKITTSNTFTAPGVRVVEVSNFTPTTARVSAKITNNGGADVVSYGVAYSETDPTPNADTPTKQEFNGNPTNGDFVVNLANLKPNTKYYVVAYARNNAVSSPGISPVVTFNTPEPIVAAKVTVSEANDVKETSAVLNGNITEYGSLKIIDHGFVYSQSNADPRLNAKDCDFKSLGNLTKSQSQQISTPVVGLKKGSNYYYRSYVKPEGGQEIYSLSVQTFVTKEDNLRTYYSFSGDYTDVSGNANHAQSTGSKFVNDRFGSLNKAVDVSTGAVTEILTSKFGISGELTFSIWLKFNDSNFIGGKKVIIGHGDQFCPTSSSFSGFMIYFDPARSEGQNGDILFFIRDGSNAPLNVKRVIDRNNIDTKIWHHIVIVKSGSKWRFYLDGQLQTSETFLVNFTSLGNHKTFTGASWTSCSASEGFSNLNAQMDDVRRYNKAFSDTEVRELYNREKP